MIPLVFSLGLLVGARVAPWMPRGRRALPSAIRVLPTFGRHDDARHEALPDRDPNRKALAAAIALHAGARRDLRVANEAASLAAQNCWAALARLEELRKGSATLSNSRADKFIASVGAGAPCDTAVLEKSKIDSRAQIMMAENDVATWDETRLECDLAAREKKTAAVAAREKIEKAARIVIVNPETVKRLSDDLAALQTDVVNARSVLRFLWGKGVNGELSGPLKERVERLLWRDLMGMESTSASAAWQAAFEKLLQDHNAELPGD